MTSILHITDTHIVPEGQRVSARLDTSAALARLVDRITSIRDQIDPIDAVLVSGDLTDAGDPESYARFKTLMAPLDLPLLVIPGNHDLRTPMRAAFPDHLPPSGALNWSRRVGEVTLIGLDTLVEGQGSGTLTSDTLTFLRSALHQAGGAPVLLALHHPPFASGIWFMDASGLTNDNDLRDVLTGYPGDIRIVCGHIHSMMVSGFAGHIAISAPSPCSTFAHDRRADAPKGFMQLEDGCLLHHWNDGFTSVRIGPAAGPGPFPFRPL